MAHGGEEGAFGMVGTVGLLLGKAQFAEQAFADLQLLLQGLFGGGAPGDQAAQVTIPQDDRSDSQAGHQEDLQDQTAIVAPGVVADQGVGAPAVGKQGHFVRLDAQQGLVEDAVQLVIATGSGEGGNRRVVIEQCGNTQAVLEQAADEIGGIDLRGDGRIGPALGDILHQGQRVGDLDQFDAGMLAAQGVGEGRAADQGQPLALQGRGGIRGIGADGGDQHPGRGQVRAGEFQAPGPFAAIGQGADQVGLAAFHQLDHLRHAFGFDDLEMQAGTQADLFQQVGGNAAELLLVVEKGQRREVFVDHHLQAWVATDPRLFASFQLQRAAVEQRTVEATAPAPGDIDPVALGQAGQGLVDDSQEDGVVVFQGEAEGRAQWLDVPGDLYAVAVMVADQVIGADGVADEGIGIALGEG